MAPDDPKTPPASASAKRKRDSRGENSTHNSKRRPYIRLNLTRGGASDSAHPSDEVAGEGSTTRLQELEPADVPAGIDGRAFDEAARRNDMEQRSPRTGDILFSTFRFRPTGRSSAAASQTTPNTAPIPSPQQRPSAQLADEIMESREEPLAPCPGAGEGMPTGSAGTAQELDPFPEVNFDDYLGPSRTPSFAGDVREKDTAQKETVGSQARPDTDSNQAEMAQADASAAQHAATQEPALPNQYHRHPGERSPTLGREEITCAPNVGTNVAEAVPRPARAPDATSMPPPPLPSLSRKSFNKESSHTRGRDFKRALTEPPKAVKSPGEASGLSSPPLSPTPATRRAVPPLLSEKSPTAHSARTDEGPVTEPRVLSPTEVEPPAAAQEDSGSPMQSSVQSHSIFGTTDEPQVQTATPPRYRWGYFVEIGNSKRKSKKWPLEPSCGFEDLTESRLKERIKEQTGLDLNDDGMDIEMRLVEGGLFQYTTFMVPYGRTDAFNFIKNEMRMLAEEHSSRTASTEIQEYILTFMAPTGERAPQH